MNYYVIGSDGSKYGPADVPTLRQWFAEGRLIAASELESVATGSRLSAASAPELADLFGASAPAAPSQSMAPDFGSTFTPLHPEDLSRTPSSSQPTVPTSTPLGYQYPPSPTGSPYPRGGIPGVGDVPGKTEVVISYVLTAVGLVTGFCVCLPLPLVALYYGNKAKALGNPNATAAVVLAWLGTIGSLLTIVFMIFAVIGGTMSP